MMKLPRGKFNRALIAGELEADASFIDRDPEPHWPIRQSQDAAQLRLAEFVQTAVDAQEDTLAFVGDQRGRG
jgi:hypothetical protein